jgi:hypothetical protein
VRQLAAVSGESWYARDVSVAARFRRLPDDLSILTGDEGAYGPCASEARPPIPDVQARPSLAGC